MFLSLYFRYLHNIRLSYDVIYRFFVKSSRNDKKGIIKTDILSAEDYDDVRSRRKYKAERFNGEPRSCPTYSGIYINYIKNILFDIKIWLLKNIFL